MPLVSFDYNDFIAVLGQEIPKQTLIEKLPMLGGDFSHVNGDEINIEFFPNRPDLTSVEGIARASRSFFGLKTGLQTYKVLPSDIVLTVDKSVKKIRPFVATAFVKNVQMSDNLIVSLMGLQEKLHVGLGRNRKKVAIGVHNADPLTPPFVYKAVDPDAVSFIPLGKDESMTLRQILSRHEKGVNYAHLLDGFDAYPLIVDACDNILSFPPIINGSLTEVTPYTRNLFIDVTGTDQKTVHHALNIVVSALAERAAELYQTTVKDKEKTILSPDFTPLTQEVSASFINSILGTQFTNDEIITCLKRMGHDAQTTGNDGIVVEIGAWRADILHEVDLVEDVAIGHGFDCFQTDLPKAMTFSKMLPNHVLFEALRGTMIGLGFNEVTTFVISNPHDQYERLGIPEGKMVEIKNPIGEEYSGLRIGLLPSLLRLLEENKHHALPQQIFELGIVVDEQAKNKHHFAAVKIDAKANFTQCKSLVEAVLRQCHVVSTLQNREHGGFINGRCAAMIRNEQEIGVFGELHPKIIQGFHLEHPVIAFELYVDLLR